MKKWIKNGHKYTNKKQKCKKKVNGKKYIYIYIQNELFTNPTNKVYEIK